MIMQSQAQLFDVAGVAAELKIRPLEAQRLIARRVLPATMVGDGSWRVAASDVTAYVRAGAKDLARPKDQQLLVYVQEFERRLFVAAAAQFRSDEQLNELAQSRPTETQFVFTLSLSPAMASVVAARVDRLGFDPPGRTDVARFANWGDLYAVARLRQLVQQQQGGAWESLLYASPDDYGEIVVAAWKRLLAWKLATRETKRVPSGDGGARHIAVVYELPVVTFVSGDRLTRAEQLAF